MRKLFFFTLFLALTALQPGFIYSQSGGQNPTLLMYRWNGGGISPQPVVQGNVLGTVRWDGLTAIGSIRTGASIYSNVTNPVAPGFLQANMIFRTSGGAGLTDRMIITQNGLVGIGEMNPAYHLHVLGNTHTTGDFFGRIHFDNNAATNDAPNTYIDEVYFELKNRAVLTGGLALPASAGVQGGVLSLAPGGTSLDHQLYFGDDGIWTRRRTGNAADWTGADWYKVLTGEQIMGTPNRLAKFTAPNSLGDSRLFDDGVRVGINNFAPAFDLDISGTTRISANALVDGSLGVGTTTPAHKLHLVGDGYVNGRVAIGPTDHFASGYALSVNGKVITDEVRVMLEPAWPDYVFDENYPLPDLKEWERFIRTNKHLPGIPSASEVRENGIELGENQRLLLEKIEQLTLLLIAQQKQIDSLKKELQNVRR